jgi:hypothetical protein
MESLGTKIAGFGPASDRYNVLLSDGYRSSEMPQYESDAQNFANAALHPYDPMPSERNFRTINVWRVDELDRQRRR